ncbi:beta-lactamase family protein [Gordonia sp. TBRC 11910]|uniref:Beta-lactamase family protein n=1 Tax=Gordonia asplenii TaxID=2725283 RepID=A0A848L6P2_9ACTN|nr:serine hydrolase domain-containing protein [Gordonia asplenii]NMO03278.1 beta-lactamase family protein [Gordonia asplenii]
MSVVSRSRLAVSVLVSAVAIAGCSSSSSTPTPTSSATVATSTTMNATTTAALQTVLDDARARSGAPGALARIISPHGTWTGVSGTTAAGGTTKPQPTDHTRVGSLTKTMTATVLLQLVQEGKVALDDPLGKYLPSAPNATATLRQVADMTSGIPSYTASNAFTDKYFAHPEQAWQPQQLVDVAKSMPPVFAPGKGWQYSNTNYVLLGMVIEKVLDQPIDKVLSERLFGPLGMADTSFPGESTQIASPYLSGLTNQGQPAGRNADSTHWNPSMAFTAGAVISTLDDLQKWAAALFTGTGVLDAKTQQLRRDSILHSPPPNSPTAGYGIGIGDRGGWWGHDGDIPGYNSVLFHNYPTDTTVIVLTNTDNSTTIDGKPTPAAQAIFASLSAALPK